MITDFSDDDMKLVGPVIIMMRKRIYSELCEERRGEAITRPILEGRGKEYTPTDTWFDDLQSGSHNILLLINAEIL